MGSRVARVMDFFAAKFQLPAPFRSRLGSGIDSGVGGGGGGGGGGGTGGGGGGDGSGGGGIAAAATTACICVCCSRTVHDTAGTTVVN